MNDPDAAITLAASRTSLKPRVLVIEDDDGVAKIVGRTLGSGYELAYAADGLAGLELASTGAFDLVLLDLLLPDIDGATLLSRLVRAHPEQQVIVISAMSNVESKVRCLELGAADYLAKPFALQELAARVNARLRRPVRIAEPRQGEAVLDVARRTVTTAGHTITLSGREFALLEHLMRHEGDVCTRKQLLESVWGYTFDPGTNIVDVYIRRLRAKLENLPIETIRNVGYAYAPS
jgi:two-component system, OmpR family, response regulator